VISYHGKCEQDVVRFDKPHDVPSCEESSGDGHYHKYKEGIKGNADVSAMVVVSDNEERWQRASSRHGGYNS
jgi:hypothetical protein